MRDWAKRSNVEVEGEYVDRTSSADTRPQKELVLRKLRLNEIDGLAIYALDRWGRNVTELILELDEFGRTGKSIISLKEGIDLTTAAGRMMANMLAIMANFERDRIRERTKLGLARVKAQGKALGHPVGVKNTHRRSDAGKHRNKTSRVNPQSSVESNY